MKISFIPLTKNDFSLLLKWLNEKHVKFWWDQETIYNNDLIKEKYISYVHGYKFINGEKKLIYAYIINIDSVPIGYIQLYNAYDFLKILSLDTLPKSLGAIDFYIGEKSYLGKGLAEKILKQFNYRGFEYILVDPDINNIKAIKAYEKAGFIKHKQIQDVVLMIKKNIEIVSTENAIHYKRGDSCDAWLLKRD